MAVATISVIEFSEKVRFQAEELKLLPSHREASSELLSKMANAMISAEFSIATVAKRELAKGKSNTDGLAEQLGKVTLDGKADEEMTDAGKAGGDSDDEDLGGGRDERYDLGTKPAPKAAPPAPPASPAEVEAAEKAKK